VSFHCLRHTANTLMKKAGVPEAVVRDIVGHDTMEISRLYTHIDGSAKRDGVNRLPNLGATSKGLSRSGPLARQRRRR
jgi:integrase